MDPYDRIWDPDRSFTPFHVATGFKVQLTFNQSNLVEKPPAIVLQSARVLARRNTLTYNLSLDAFGDYYIILYFAGILPVFPSFDVIINGDLVESNYKIKSSEISALYVVRKGISSLNITLRSISFYPQINALEVYQMADIPSEASSTTGSSPSFLIIHIILISTIVKFNLNYGFGPFNLCYSSFSTTGYSAVHWVGFKMARRSMLAVTMGSCWM